MFFKLLYALFLKIIIVLISTGLGWASPTAFHLKDEFQQFIDLGLSKSLGQDNQIFQSAAQKMRRKNTDASRLTQSVSISFSL